MNKDNKNILNDSGIERAVLSGIFNHGSDLLIDIEEILEAKDFYWSINQKIFMILKHLVHDKNIEKFDIPTVSAGAKFINYNKFNENGKESEYLEALFSNSPTLENTKSLATCIFKLSLARHGCKCVENIIEDLKGITGNEKIDEILKKIEEPIFEFTSSLIKNNNGIIHICDNIEEEIKALSESPKDTVGLSSGFPLWDNAIGGGLRRGTINVIGARAKGAKSFACLNIARNMAESGIPILYLDTELTRQQQLYRLMGLISGVETLHIETGKFSTNKEENDAILSCSENFKNIPITHCSIAGLPMEAIFSYARRWIIKNVGLNSNGEANPCVVIYDYIKLMDGKELGHNTMETQLLGFLMSSLHNFALKYSIPVLATVQLNRDGVEKEGGEVISGSDRILWLCSNFTILKNKLQEELIEDPPSNGTKKFVVTDTRFGPGMNKGDYINIIADLSRAKLKEGKMLSQNISNSFLNLKA